MSTACDENSKEKNKKMSSTVLDSFRNLLADDERTRQDAGLTLLRHLSQLKVNSPDGKELEYSLKRLVRGLGSSRTTAKRGFFSTLTAYIRLHQDIDVQSVLQIMESELKSSGSNSKSENADIYMGRILLCGSLIRSKLLTKCPVEEQQKIIEIILNAGTKRSYLSFVSTSFLIELLDGIDEEPLRTNIWPLLEKELAKGWEEHSLDTFYALLVMNSKFPSLVGKKFFLEHLGSKTIIDGTSIDKLVKLVTETPRFVCYRHPLYKIFCEKLATSEHLTQFWDAIDQRFTKPSKNLENLAIQMLNLVITNIKNKDLIPSLLSPNFLQHMLKRFTSSKPSRRDDVALAFRQFLSHLITALKDKEIKPKTQIAVLKKLILHPGDLMIEKITGTKTIQMITFNMGAEGVKKLSKFYTEIIKNLKPKQINDKEEFWTNAERTYVGQLLSKLLGHAAMSSEHAWRLEQLKLLFNLGLCEVANVSTELASQFRESFYRALDHKLPKLTDLRIILSQLIAHFNKELFTNKTQTLRTSLSEEAMETWNTMINFIEKLDTDSGNNKAPLIFYIMDVNMALQLFIDSEMAISSIKEIHSCSERLSKSKKKMKKPKTDEEEEPEWVEVIVDLLLSLLSKHNHLLRSLVCCVFPHLCPVLTSASIHQILSVLDPKDDKGPLVPKDAEDSDEEIDESDEEDNESSEEDDDVDMEEDEDDEDDEDDEEDDETVIDRLRLAVRQALGDASIQTDDADDIDEPTEEEGRRLDESLVSAFRILRESRRSSKQKQSKSAEALTHFRVRVIDLLEIYLESGPSMALVLDMIVPLFALLEFCIKDPHQKPLENRVRNCLRKLSLVKKFKDSEGVDETLLTDLARVLIEKGEKSTAICQEMGDKLAECCTFLIRCVQQSGMPSSTLVPTVRDNLSAFFKKRDCVLPASMFKNILQLSWDGNWQLIPLLEEYAFDKTIRSFRRGQALEFLIIFYRNHRMVKSEEHTSVRQKLEKKLSKHTTALLQELANSNVTTNGDSQSVVNGDTPKTVRQKFVCLLWTLLHAVYPNHIAKSWDWKSISDAMAQYRLENTLSKDAKTAYNKLASQIGAPRNIKRQHKNTIQNGHHDDQDNKNGIKEEENMEPVKKKIKIDKKSRVALN